MSQKSQKSTKTSLPVRIAEDNLGEGSTTAGVVDDFLHDTADVAVTFSEIKGAELGSTLTANGVSLEDRTTTFSLRADNATHGKY